MTEEYLKTLDTMCTELSKSPTVELFQREDPWIFIRNSVGIAMWKEYGPYHDELMAHLISK